MEQRLTVIEAGLRPAAAPPLPRCHRPHRIGKYLLSGAAALLVLLSAATLIAMWWDAIPDLVKVSTVFVIGVVLTVIGTWLSTRRPGSLLHAATATGIGGGLGFVGLMGPHCSTSSCRSSPSPP